MGQQSKQAISYHYTKLPVLGLGCMQLCVGQEVPWKFQISPGCYQDSGLFSSNWLLVLIAEHNTKTTHWQKQSGVGEYAELTLSSSAVREVSTLQATKREM